MTSGSPAWLQILLSALGLLGGTGGVAAAAMVLVQRRKLRADAADVISDAAVGLVAPLKARIAELETDALSARRKLSATNGELDQLRDSVRDLTRMLLRIRTEILSPDADLARLRELVRTVPAPRDVNGRG